MGVMGVRPGRSGDSILLLSTQGTETHLRGMNRQTEGRPRRARGRQEGSESYFLSKAFVAGMFAATKPELTAMSTSQA